MKQKALLLAVIIIAAVFSSAGCITTRPSETNFRAPVITLETLNVPHYDGYWYYAGSIEPTKGRAGDRGAPLSLSFLFSVRNPNPYDVMLDGLRFKVAFDGEFDVAAVSNNDSHWIPAGKATHVRCAAVITVRSVYLNLLAADPSKLKERDWTPWDALERWWEGVPAASVPVTLRDGNASFRANGVFLDVPVEGEYP